MQRTPAAAEAVSRPPSCLAEFNCRPLPLQENDLALAVDFALACKSCGGGAFEISAFPLKVLDPSPYFGVEPGETIQRPPHGLKCVSCGSHKSVFDVRTQGYDGVLNGGGAYESGADGQAFIGGAFSVVAVVCYNIELDRLFELAGEAKVLPSDLFDVFSLVGTSVSGGDVLELSYECA